MGLIWAQMGFPRWPLAFSVMVIAGLTLVSAVRLYQPGATGSLRTKVFVDAILFWGGFAVIAGFLGTLIGVIIAAQSIEQAGQVSTALAWGGIKIALLSSTFGVLILMAASLAWFGLQFRWRMLIARDADEG